MDYFLDLMYGEVVVYYEYDDHIFYQTSDSQTIFHWDPLYQTTGNLFKGTKAWKVALIKDYIIPAIPDGYFSQRIGYPSPEAGRDYHLLIAGVLTNNAQPDADNPNEFVNVAIMCGDVIERSFTFTGVVDEEIHLTGCAEAVVSGIRSTSWPARFSRQSKKSRVRPTSTPSRTMGCNICKRKSTAMRLVALA